jgi:hypothetical protein
MMRRLVSIVAGLALGGLAAAPCANAQWGYPRGYGGYGMSRWGADPGAGYMAGLGAYARGQGVYQLDKAKADAINADTMIKWNKALRARQLALREDQRKEAAQREAQRQERAAELRLENGSTLNDLLFQILDVDPGVVRSARARAPLSPSALKEIPFEWNSEAITLCIDQMTGASALPSLLMDDRFAPQRTALKAAVESALKEDAQGSVSLATRKKLDDAVAKLRTEFLKNNAEFQLGYQESIDYLTTMASLSRLLNDPSMHAFLAQLDNGQERTVGDLIAFMNAYNLRFGPATTDRQIEIYTRLAPTLKAVRDAAGAEGAPRSEPDRTGEGLQSAAKAAFKGMSWDHLEAHAREH